MRTKTKTIKSFSVNIEQFDKFKARCKSDKIKMSAVLDKMMAEFLAKQPTNNNEVQNG